MKLTPTQLKYLSLASEKPLSKPDEIPMWWQKLWIADMVDVVGNSVYITDKGREALESERRG